MQETRGKCVQWLRYVRLLYKLYETHARNNIKQMPKARLVTFPKLAL